jgi:hypothetical protein
MISLIKKKGINPQDKSMLYFAQWTRVSTVNETKEKRKFFLLILNERTFEVISKVRRKAKMTKCL